MGEKLTKDEVRQDWREMPFSDLRPCELAAMSSAEKRWHADWQRYEHIAAARLAGVNAVVAKSSEVEVKCWTCSDWHNANGNWGACTSRDSMSPDELRVPSRVTLGHDTCEAWSNPNAIFSDGKMVGVHAGRAALQGDGGRDG